MTEKAPGVLLQVCPNDLPPFVDICRYYEAAARSLGWRVTTVLLNARAPTRAPDLNYLDAGQRHRPGPALVRQAHQLLDGQRPSLVLCHRYRAYRTALDSGVEARRVVTVAHEFGFFGRRRRRWLSRLDGLLGRPPVVFAGVSTPVVAELTRAMGPATLLPNGIDLARADATRLSRDDARAHLGLGPAPFTVGVVGRLHRKKCPGLAVEGFRAALPAMPGARLVFIGDGEMASELQSLSRDLPVLFQGFVADAPRVMAALDLLLLPSGQHEAFGLVALEAMAAGVVVLCGPAPGPGFVVGDTGRRFAPATVPALAEALADAFADARTGLLEQAARRGRARVEEVFSVPAGARRLQELAPERVVARQRAGLP